MQLLRLQQLYRQQQHQPVAAPVAAAAATADEAAAATVAATAAVDAAATASAAIRGFLVDVATCGSTSASRNGHLVVKALKELPRRKRAPA